MSSGNGVAVGMLSSRSRGDNEPAHYLLKVEAFSLLSECGIFRLESNTFESGDYKWRLVLYPNGNMMDEGGNHISLYLRIVDTDSLPEGWEVNVYFKFYVYDHIRKNYLTIQDADGKKRRFHSSKLECGFAKFLPLKIFKDTSSGFLFQDTCLFGVEVFVAPKFVLKENCLSLMRPPTPNNSYSWTIEKFSSIKEKSIFSEDFKVGSIKWKLKLYPKGVNKGSNTHLSLFLALADCQSLPVDFKIYAKYTFCIRDQSGNDHVNKKVTGCWFCAEKKVWGIQCLIPLSDLEDKGKSYLVKDRLIVDVDVAALGVIKSFT